MVKNIRPGASGSGPADFTAVRGTMYFSAGRHGRQLWRSDGTRAGTVMLSDFTDVYRFFDLAAVGRTVYFSVRRTTRGDQLWKTDGTRARTVLVKNIAQGGHSCPAEYLTDVEGALYFNTGVRTYGQELWKSDGTGAGTVLVRDIWPGPSRFPAFDEACQYGPAELTDLEGTLFFNTDDGTHGSELWKSDGTQAGTVLVRDIWPGHDPPNPEGPHEFTIVNGVMYFFTDDGTHGYELWKSDGTRSRTVLVKDIWPGRDPSSYYPTPGDLTEVRGTLYFFANNGTSGLDLWESDGTEAGTVMVKDLQRADGRL